MAKVAWPLAAELTSRLSGLGIASLPTGVVADDMIAAAVSAFEQQTGWVPFLQTTSGSRYLHPTFDYVLPLGCGYTAISAVKTGYSPSDAGTTLTVNVDYWLEPLSARDENKPYTQIRFNTRQAGQPRSIVVTGTRGYNDTIPEDAWQAVMAYACVGVILVKNGYIGPVADVTQGTVKVGYSVEADRGSVAALSMQFNMAVARYRWVRFG